MKTTKNKFTKINLHLNDEMENVFKKYILGKFFISCSLMICFALRYTGMNYLFNISSNCSHNVQNININQDLSLCITNYVTNCSEEKKSPGAQDS